MVRDKRNRTVRLDSNTLNKLKTYKREVETIEEDDIPLGEIITRMSSGEDMLRRLRDGARERRTK